ncbi:hypothetical protein NXY38_11600 [Bacteroides thetaiotaomicron]|uniref:hypothetical protein n=1 Tax=Bacteroides TaxID=816 RepID=UPI002164582F|nr:MULTISPECIES: hypothetical protein [Bacteroides]MCS2591413.1 hypothetical protein [Bacteroides thetaiotaomicron]MCS2824545.1 hypothetical protein [Bacteroides ovatus]UVQ09054.1 hypothetical protein NXW81_16485 [Bacteroides xylanisolvens]UVV87127.1 hypothetical protein NXY38_11600 [Bacteroides thetaiotaomicron]
MRFYAGMPARIYAGALAGCYAGMPVHGRVSDFILMRNRICLSGQRPAFSSAHDVFCIRPHVCGQGGCVIARIRSHVQSKPLKTRVVCSFSAMAACGVKVDASGVIAYGTSD